jgi:phenylacetate-CoA ligase
MICNSEVEAMPRDALRQLQMARLKKELTWAYEKSPFYQNLMERAGITPEDINSFDDLKKMPFTTKKDLLTNSPFDFLTGPLSSTLRVRCNGDMQPIVKMCSNGDIARIVEMTSRAFVAAGVNMASIVKMDVSSLNVSMLDMLYAAEVVGATVIPPDGADLSQRIRMLDLMGADVLAGDSQILLQMLVAAQAMEFDFQQSRVNKLLCLTHTMHNYMGAHLKERYNADLFHIYAPIEAGATAMFYECEEHKCHIQEDYYYAEIINMQSGEVVDDGAMGELVLTSLYSESMPMIRYRTGLIVAMDRQEPCKCGRTFSRLMTY